MTATTPDSAAPATAAEKQEFSLDKSYDYDRSGPVRWIASHLARYPWLPLLALGATIINNFAASYIQVVIGEGFDLISTPGWANTALLFVAALAFGAAVTQGLMGLTRNISFEFMAQRIERDARDELYVSLLGKSQTFHGQQRIGDIMARATNDVRTLNIMFSPGLMLIMDSMVGIVVPMVLIALIDVQLLLVPVIFLVLFVITVCDYNRQLNPVSISLREQFGAMNAGLAETIAGIEVVKGNAQEQQEQDEFVGNAARLPRLLRAAGHHPGPLSAHAGLQHLLGRGVPARGAALAGGRPDAGPGRHLYGAVRRPALPDLHLDLLLQPGPAGRRQRPPHPGADQHRDGAGRERGRHQPTHRGQGGLSRTSASATRTRSPAASCITFCATSASWPSRAKRSPSSGRPAPARRR